MYKNNHAPFKFDIVGSFLRPDYLKEAREQLKKGMQKKGYTCEYGF